MGQNQILLVGYVVVVFVAMYLLWIAPQNRQRKAQAAMLESLVPGDEVVTSGGLMGIVRKIEEERVSLEVSEDVDVWVAKQAIAVRVSEVPQVPLANK